MKSVLFRVDANPDIGLGHLMRCLALAQHLVAREYKVTFAVLLSTVPYCESRSDWVGDLYVIPSANTSDTRESLTQYVDKYEFDWVVLDGYQFTQDYRKALSSGNAKLAVFDDENNSGQLHADLVINGASHQAAEGYKKTAPLAKLCIGDRFRVLRTEFTTLVPKFWEQRQFLTIVFGGSDPFNLTMPVLLELDSLSNDKALSALPPIKVLTGPAYSKVEELQILLSKLTLNVEHIHNCENVSSMLNESKLVISAAGGTQFELLACHTPAVLVIVAENQKLATFSAQTQGWCRVVENGADSVTQVSQIAHSLCNDPFELKYMHQNTKKYSGANGANRIIDLMLT